MSIDKGIYFVKGKSPHKYTAMIPNGSGRYKKVNFGNSNYQQYKDSIPKNLGGGLWSSKNHMDETRRRSYRARHGALMCKNGSKCISIKNSPAWFSYYFLW